jgi:small subunit ribosomal protein S14
MRYRKQIKDINKRKLYIKTELIQRVVKILCFSFNTSLMYFALFNSYIVLAQNNDFKNRVKNFCIVSGRSRGVHKKFKVSRIVLRELSSKGYFFGLKKASW